ncbi:hypothetical protein AG1IA_06489 [Rhizoctonia solani AG-1 IA]|uniref:Uncharacterized protein n=1 Tax=Thanatephorus cucumeris (strain AG1-IA) TaxID=983506 RepID=L8WNC5_THACA|nr:hypothetical protein AG1IA_06489 [Rhizoctonia solani AG-1 IA]
MHVTRIVVLETTWTAVGTKVHPIACETSLRFSSVSTWACCLPTTYSVLVIVEQSTHVPRCSIYSKSERVVHVASHYLHYCIRRSHQEVQEGASAYSVDQD